MKIAKLEIRLPGHEYSLYSLLTDKGFIETYDIYNSLRVVKIFSTVFPRVELLT